MIEIPFVRPWNVRTPILTRYLEQEYVDEFFDSGKLRISSFKAFRKHEDAQRGDTSEGTINSKITTPSGAYGTLLISNQEAYVLCASTIENKNMEATFETNSGFRINNSLGFANAVSRYIPGFYEGMEGLCSYRKDTLIQKYDDNLSSLANRMPNNFESPEAGWNETNRYANELANEAFFIKHISYSHQGEYRMIWIASGGEKQYIDIICPEALQFCQPLKDL